VTPAEQVRLRWGVPGRTKASVAHLPGDRRVVLVDVDATHHGGSLGEQDSITIAAGGRLALDQRLPLVIGLASSGAEVREGVASLHGWGKAAQSIATCSGTVPVVVLTSGPAVSGHALLLGMADVVIMTTDAVAYVSGPAAVAELTGLRVGPGDLGGHAVHARSTGVAAMVATNPEEALVRCAELLEYLPDHTDEIPPHVESDDPPDRLTPELNELLPASDSGSYDVRSVIRSVADDGELLELRPGWAPQLVTGLVHVGGRSIGVVANQPQSMAGTLDIAASQKGARFVSFCDSFNIALLTLVDTPGFMPGKDLEWRGMIRHGAQLVYAYAEATVPRVCLVLRKAFGGAYIVMDSKGIGNDICLAWPSAQVAVMGAQGAVQILHRRAEVESQARLVQEYGVAFLNPYVAAARGYIDQVIQPAATRQVVAAAMDVLESKRERLVARKHGNGPL
jgi:acetyl-CoA carboxylase carboxyltransferase component